MYNIGDIFYLDNDYSNKAEWCNENGYMIVEIEADEKGRRFQILEQPAPTEEEILANLRARRIYECFTVINRGELWYAKLTTGQKAELSQWYENWLDVTDTKVIPTKPNWLK